MNNPHTLLPSTRREFLRTGARGIGLLAFSRFAPDFLTSTALAGAPPPESDRSILVLIQLAGGNDGLNTLVPYADDHYHRLRPTIGLKTSDVLRIDDHHGLHPSLAPFREMLDAGSLGVVQNVGYPNPNRSHFRSTEIWETASESDDYLPSGWLGRFFDNQCGGTPATAPGATATPSTTPTPSDIPVGIHASNEVPPSFLGENPHNIFGLSRGALRPRHAGAARLVEGLLAAEPAASAGAGADDNLSFLQHTMLDALATEKRIQRVLGGMKPDGAYPGDPFANALRGVAELIAARLPTRVYFVSLGGFDTHGNQLGTHAQLLKQLADGMAAFQKDLTRRGLADQVLTMTFSEFGRRPSENESKGTDHGTAAPLFVMGSRLKAGLHGTAPSLDVGANRDLAFSTDFRRVYATVLDRWLGCDARAVLGASFKPVEFL
ncbi:MAG: DUF1501 domain-containing protein [Opitutaceae bacterium]|nr:DUF1501 domain-containing protein [Opitutaceae bacterium]